MPFHEIQLLKKRTYLNNYIFLSKRTLIFVFCWGTYQRESHKQVLSALKPFRSACEHIYSNTLTLVIGLGKSFTTGVAAKQCPSDWLI